MPRNNHHTCCDIALQIQTYLAGHNQVTHPNVITFAEPWNGYKFWMGYTPYPFANGEEENPSIAGSNDMLNWEKPIGTLNPIAFCEETECDELKDSHLLYNPDTDELELWYLGRIGSTMKDGTPLVLFRKRSKDGRIWTPYEILYQTDSKNIFVSPSILRENGRYYLWGIRNNKKEIGLYRMSSEDASVWTEWEECQVPFSKETGMWHGTITHINGKYQFVWIGIHCSCSPNGIKQQSVFFAQSENGTSFINADNNNTSCKNTPFHLVHNDTGWRALYRPCLAYAENFWYCFYGVIRIDNKWAIGVSKGQEYDQLLGVTQKDLKTSENLIATSYNLRLNKIAKDLIGLFIKSSAIIIPILIIIQFLLSNSLLTLLISIILCALYYRVRIWKRNVINAGLVNGSIWAIFSIAFLELLKDIFELISLIIK